MADRQDSRSRKYPSPPTPPESYFTEPHYADEFIIPASNEDGTPPERCQFRCNQQLYAWMSEVVASRRFPFKRDGDLMRWALFYGLRSLARIDQTVGSLQALVEAQNEVTRFEELRAQITDHVDRLEKLISELQVKQAWGRIVSVLGEEHRKADEGMAFDAYWAERWRSMLHDRFAAIEMIARSRVEAEAASAPPVFRMKKKTAPESKADGNGGHGE